MIRGWHPSTINCGSVISDSLITLREKFSIVIVSLAGMVNHEWQVADQLALATSRDRGLMHVQRTGKRRLHRLQSPGRPRRRHRPRVLSQGLQLRFPAGNRWQGLVAHGRRNAPLILAVDRTPKASDSCHIGPLRPPPG